MRYFVCKLTQAQIFIVIMLRVIFLIALMYLANVSFAANTSLQKCPDDGRRPQGIMSHQIIKNWNNCYGPKWPGWSNYDTFETAEDFCEYKNGEYHGKCWGPVSDDEKHNFPTGTVYQTFYKNGAFKWSQYVLPGGKVVPFKSQSPKDYQILEKQFSSKSPMVRKSIQTRLQIEGFYKGKIDGLFGDRTWRALRQYNKVNTSADLETVIGARALLSKISSVSKVPSIPTAKTSEPPGVLNCENDAKYCSAVELCMRATDEVDGEINWKDSILAKPYVATAKKVGLSCNVTEQSSDQKLYRVASGTGFYVANDGSVVTNSHVIEGCNEMRLHVGSTSLQATVVADDPINDLAVLKSEMSRSPFLKLSKTNPYLLQDVVASGYPFGDKISRSIKVTRGVVSSLTGIADNVSRIQIDAAIQPGNSGGPILDEFGNVVGVAVARLNSDYAQEEFGSRPKNVNFAIKVSVVKDLLETNNIKYETGQNQVLNNAQLGNMASESTVFLSCWMTSQQYQKMREQKVLFENAISEK